jgi:Flp pilus assembly protein TadB
MNIFNIEHQGKQNIFAAPDAMQAKTTTKGGIDMKIEQYIRAIAGSFVLISVLLAYFHSRNWLFFTAFVGLNLLQSAFTKWCPMESFLEKLGIPRDNR